MVRMDELDALLDDALDDMTAARRAPATDAGVGSSSSSSANPSLPPRGLGKAIFDPLAKPGKGADEMNNDEQREREGEGRWARVRTLNPPRPHTGPEEGQFAPMNA